MTGRLVGYSTDDEVDGRRLVLARCRPDEDGAAAELAALVTLAGPHTPALLDVGTAGNGDTVLVLRDDPVRLVDLLAAPGGLAPAEAVTVLIPLIRTLEQSHAAGVAHGAVTAAAVRLTADGMPVLHEWRSAVVSDRDGPGAFAAAAERDRAAVIVLVGRLAGAAAAERLAGLDPVEAVDALFAIAEPEPVRLDRRSVPDPGTPGRLWAAAPRLAPADVEPTTGTVAATARRALASLRTVRLRVWSAAAAAVVLLITALVLLPGRGADADARPATSRPAVRAASPRASAPIAPRSLGAAEAATRLLRVRSGCTTTTCLGAVDQAGSPVVEADLLALRAHRTLVVDPGDLRPVSTLGEATVLESKHLTVLVVRGADSWSLRDVVPRH